MRTVVAVGGSLSVGLRGITRCRRDGSLESGLCLRLGPRLAALDGQLARGFDRRLVRRDAATKVVEQG